MLQKNITLLVAFYRVRTVLRACTWIAIVLLCGSSPTTVLAQSEEMALHGQVNDLLQQLRNDDIGLRDEAETAIGNLSPDALDFIDVPDRNATTDYIERLLRARKTLEKKAIALTVKPSIVNLESGVTIDQAIKNILAQTGNRIVLNEDIDPSTGQKKLTSAIENGSFWDALDALLAAGNLEVDPYGGYAGMMMLRPADSAPLKDSDDASGTSLPITAPNATAGMLHIEVRRINSSRSTRNPALSFTTVELLTRWEPRVTPISIELETRTLEIIDDQGEKIPLGKTSRASGVLQAEIPEVSFPVNLPLISRDIKQLDQIKGTLQAVLPGRLETFKFKGLDDLEDGVQQTKSGATVTWHGYEKNEDLFAVTVELSFDEESNSVDSHLSWAYDNVVELVSDDQRFDPVASETVMQRGQRVKVQYLFEEDPADCDLIYKTPAAIVKVDLDFELSDVPLP